MEKTGGSLELNYQPFKYPGRSPLLLDQFLSSRPDIRDLYIYDLNLSSGLLLYNSRGGIGVCKERYVVDMHQAIANPSFADAFYEIYSTNLNEDGIFSRVRYLRLREKFNESVGFSLQLKQAATLYLLWHFSNYVHKYRGRGCDAIYRPNNKLPSYEDLKSLSKLSREKGLMFRKEDLLTFSESLIHGGVVVYFHIPSSYGPYGCSYTWTEDKLKFFCSVAREMSGLGRKVCISTTPLLRGGGGRSTPTYSNLLPNFDQISVSEFKGTKLSTSFGVSEEYFINF